MANLNGLRDYGNYGDETPNTVLQLCLDAAIGWFDGAGVPEPDEDIALYDLGVYRLAAFYADRRGLMDSGTATDAVPQGIQGIVHQLRGGGG